MKVLVVAVLSMIIGGCSLQPDISAQDPDIKPVLSGEVVFNRPIREDELPDENLLELDAEIRSYLETLSPNAIPESRLQALVSMVSERELFFEYDVDSTLPAREAYHQQRGNCLTFTLMMVAMARELGAEAYFNEVEVPPVWDQEEEEIFVVYRHVNMVAKHYGGRRIIDLNLEAYDPTYQQRALDDVTAFALYYSNRGVELLREGSEEQAFLYLRKALEMKPDRSDFWSNIGAFYSHFGHNYEAEQSYLQALSLEPSNLVAVSNLEWLYKGLGREEEAEVFAGLVQYHRDQNPYFHYYMATKSYEAGEYAIAEKHLNRALRQAKQVHRFHFLLGLSRYKLGKFSQAKESLKQAFELAGSSETIAVYEQKLDTFLKEVDRD
ncbi:hypothetical protein ACJJI4_00905 [Microbulbifer sp. TRSA002]|uniref:tetratricopeptide repeat protein n=1 Tax=Microbulbifer sp. TRSA002 TaxID=3243382 RepID=UPI004039198E